MYPHSLTRMVLAAVITLAAVGCGGSRDTASPFDRSPSATEIQLNVDNQNYNDVRLYIETVAGRKTVGGVGGNSRRSFRIEWAGLDGISVRMQFLAGDDFVTNSVNASPGDRLELLITANPRHAVLRRR